MDQLSEATRTHNGEEAKECYGEDLAISISLEIPSLVVQPPSCYANTLSCCAATFSYAQTPSHLVQRPFMATKTLCRVCSRLHCYRNTFLSVELPSVLHTRLSRHILLIYTFFTPTILTGKSHITRLARSLRANSKLTGQVNIFFITIREVSLQNLIKSHRVCCSIGFAH